MKPSTRELLLHFAKCLDTRSQGRPRKQPEHLWGRLGSQPAAEVTRGHGQGRGVRGGGLMWKCSGRSGAGAWAAAAWGPARPAGSGAQRLAVTRRAGTPGAAAPCLPRPRHIFPNKSGPALLWLRISPPRGAGGALLQGAASQPSQSADSGPPSPGPPPPQQTRLVNEGAVFSKVALPPSGARGRDPDAELGSAASAPLLGWGGGGPGASLRPFVLLSSSSCFPCPGRAPPTQLQKEVTLPDTGSGGWIWPLGATGAGVGWGLGGTSQRPSQPRTREGRVTIRVWVSSTFELWLRERTACTATPSLPATKNVR